MDMEFWYSQFNTIGYQPYTPSDKIAQAAAEAKAEAEHKERD